MRCMAMAAPPGRLPGGRLGKLASCKSFTPWGSCGLLAGRCRRPLLTAGYLLRVYDVRIDPDWLRTLAEEVCGGPSMDAYFVGGDFLTQPYVEDSVALHPTDLRRWGPDVDTPYRLIVPPRAHVAAWAQRCVTQLPMEAVGTVCMMCAVVPRTQLTGGEDLAALQRMLPQAAALFTCKDLQVEVRVVGQRAPVCRVPASKDQKALPPPTWEKAWLPIDRVLVVLVIRRTSSPWRLPPVCPVRGDLPAPVADGLELLRLEYQLPPATKQSNAEKAARAALRKLAAAMQLPDPPGPRPLRQVVVQHGGVVALLAVPKAQALHWLRGSGCGGLYLRPFWTGQTDASISRERFSLLWLRGKAERGPELWQTFKDKPGVVGLLLTGRDVALRVDQSAKVEQLQAQLALSLGSPDEKFRRAVVGQRWWRLGPLTEAEGWQASEMARSVGLEPLRGELRFAQMGKWRHCVFFSAVGNPSKLSFDNGTRGSSEAYLVEANPPPRTAGKTAMASVKPASGTTLLTSSTWAGPQRKDLQPQRKKQELAEVPLSRPSPWNQPQRQPQRNPPTVPALPTSAAATKRPPSAPRTPVPTPFGYYSEDQPVLAATKPSRRRKKGSQGPRPDELEELRGLIQDLRTELRALRRENELLRRAQVQPWQQPPPSGLQLPVTPSRMPPLQPPQFTPVAPVPVSPIPEAATITGDVEMLPGGTLGSHRREAGDTPDGKRVPKAARALVVDESNDV
jgi:hypothetical protein